jgi:4-diphosphocytidyl-2-C-methyl-D-erythritol kinase
MKSYAYAKLNLALKILGQRPDGYHELDMIMQRISLCDELTIQKQDALTVSSDLPLPAENTMTRAAQVFFEYKIGRAHV